MGSARIHNQIRVDEKMKNWKILGNLYKLRLIWILGLAAWVGSFVYGFYTGDWTWPIITFLISKVIVIPANHIAMHRYFTHRSFATTKPKHVFLTWMSVLIGAGSPILYAKTHRHHHQHVDTLLDLHSPKNSILESLGLWEIKSFEWFSEVKRIKNIPKDLIKDPTIRFVHHHYYNIWFTILGIGLLLGLLVSWKIPVFIILAPLGWYILGSGIFINTLSHIKTPISYRNFDTADNSQNNKWIHWYTLGEGLHNNHHAHSDKYDQAMCTGEFDFSGWLVKKFFIVDPNDKRLHTI